MADYPPKPIMKNLQGTAKRKSLTFAPELHVTPDNSPPRPSRKSMRYQDTMEQTAGQEISVDGTQDVEIVVKPLCKNIRVSPAGLCYVPRTRKPMDYTANMSVIPMVDNQRNFFITAMKDHVSSPTKVLIIGEKYEGEEIKSKILSTQSTMGKLDVKARWKRTLDIIVKKLPSDEDISNTDYFIFLLHLNRMDGLKTVSEPLFKIQKKVSPLFNCTVLCLHLEERLGQNIVGYDSVNLFMTIHRFKHFIWNSSFDQCIKLLDGIHDSSGYHSGVTELDKNIINWSDVYEEDE